MVLQGGDYKAVCSQALDVAWKPADGAGRAVGWLREEPFVLPLSGHYSCSVFYFQLNFH